MPTQEQLQRDGEFLAELKLRRELKGWGPITPRDAAQMR